MFHPYFVPLTQALHNHMKKGLGKKNPHLIRLFMDWPQIIAPEWQGLVEPESLSHRGTLKVKLVRHGAMAFHYYKDVLKEKINMTLGQEVILKITSHPVDKLENTPLQTAQKKDSSALGKPKTLEEALTRLEKALERR